MAMSILERTREIGLMKAVGATNRDVLTIFLGEAAGIGFIGGVGGVLVGWLAGQLLNVVAVVYLAQQAAAQGGLPPSVAVYTPLWLPVFVLLFSIFIGMVSGLYPALRAATMIPVLARAFAACASRAYAAPETAFTVARCRRATARDATRRPSHA